MDLFIEIWACSLFEWKLSNYLIHDKGIYSGEKFHDRLKKGSIQGEKLLNIEFNERELRLIIKSILRLRFLIIIISLIKIRRKEFFIQVRELFSI